jgi:hypothetical protein
VSVSSPIRTEAAVDCPRRDTLRVVRDPGAIPTEHMSGMAFITGRCRRLEMNDIESPSSAHGIHGVLSSVVSIDDGPTDALLPARLAAGASVNGEEYGWANSPLPRVGNSERSGLAWADNSSFDLTTRRTKTTSLQGCCRRIPGPQIEAPINPQHTALLPFDIFIGRCNTSQIIY